MKRRTGTDTVDEAGASQHQSESIREISGPPIVRGFAEKKAPQKWKRHQQKRSGEDKRRIPPQYEEEKIANARFLTAFLHEIEDARDGCDAQSYGGNRNGKREQKTSQ